MSARVFVFRVFGYRKCVVGTSKRCFICLLLCLPKEVYAVEVKWNADRQKPNYHVCMCVCVCVTKMLCYTAFSNPMELNMVFTAVSTHMHGKQIIFAARRSIRKKKAWKQKSFPF